MSDPKVKNMEARVIRALADLEPLFVSAKLTFIARTPDLPDAAVMISNDTDHAQGALQLALHALGAGPLLSDTTTTTAEVQPCPDAQVPHGGRGTPCPSLSEASLELTTDARQWCESIRDARRPIYANCDMGRTNVSHLIGGLLRIADERDGALRLYADSEEALADVLASHDALQTKSDACVAIHLALRQLAIRPSSATAGWLKCNWCEHDWEHSEPERHGEKCEAAPLNALLAARRKTT